MPKQRALDIFTRVANRRPSRPLAAVGVGLAISAFIVAVGVLAIAVA